MWKKDAKDKADQARAAKDNGANSDAESDSYSDSEAAKDTDSESDKNKFQRKKFNYVYICKKMKCAKPEKSKNSKAFNEVQAFNEVLKIVKETPDEDPKRSVFGRIQI